MADVITSEDIYNHKNDGKITVSSDAIITSVARDAAQSLDVEIIKGQPVSESEDRSEQARENFEAAAEDFRRENIHNGNVLRLSESERQESVSSFRGKDPIENAVDESPFSPAQMRNLRAEYPNVQATNHLANCSQGMQSKTVRKAIDKYMENWHDSGMDWDYWVEEVDNAKAEFAKLINADADEIAVVSSVSEAVSSIASALDYEGDRNRILLTEAEFPTVGHVWLAHEKYGAEVDFVPLTDGEILLEDHDRMMDDRTALASITHVYYQTGYKQDLAEVADVIHANGGAVLVDAYQSAGTCNIDVSELDIDILTTGNLKYLLGVPGIAFIYVTSDLVEKLHPSETGWFGQSNPFAFDVKSLDYAETARRLEGGTPPVTAAFAAQAGMKVLTDVGLDRIERQIDYLSTQCIRGALQRGLQVASPMDIKKKGATTAIEVPGDSHDVEMALKRSGIVTSARGNVVRIAPHYFNTKQDIDMALDELVRIIGANGKGW